MMNGCGCSLTYHSNGEGVVQLPSDQADDGRGQQEQNEGVIELMRREGGETQHTQQWAGTHMNVRTIVVAL